MKKNWKKKFTNSKAGNLGNTVKSVFNHWEFIQMNEEKKEKRKRCYTLIFKKDCFYFADSKIILQCFPFTLLNYSD